MLTNKVVDMEYDRRYNLSEREARHKLLREVNPAEWQGPDQIGYSGQAGIWHRVMEV